MYKVCVECGGKCDLCQHLTFRDSSIQSRYRLKNFASSAKEWLLTYYNLLE